MESRLVLIPEPDLVLNPFLVLRNQTQFWITETGTKTSGSNTFTFIFVRPLSDHIKPKRLDLNSKTLIYSKHGIFVTFKNNRNGYWDFYHGLNMGAGLPKVG